MEEITLPQGGNLMGGGCMGSGYFNLVFLDPAWTPARQAVACQVFSDLSQFLEPAINPYDGSFPSVNSGPAAQEPKLIVFPNPGSTFIAFAVDLQVAPVEAELVVRDAVGREIRRFRLQKTQDQVIWDVRGATPGSYTVSLVSGGVLLRTEKFVLRP